MQKNFVSRQTRFVFVILCLAMLSACAGKAPLKSSGPMDSAAHHVRVGEQYLASGDAQRARTSFETAHAMEPEMSAPHLGLARIHAGQGNHTAALDHADEGLDGAQSPQEEIAARLVYIEVLAGSGQKGWLTDAEEHYEEIVEVAPGHEEARLAMADAYARAHRFEQAKPLYKQVVAANGSYAATAREHWETMQDYETSLVSVRATDELFSTERLTRAQAAALFAEELQLHRIIATHKETEAGKEFMTPSEMEQVKKEAVRKIPADIENHPLKNDILAILALNLRGLKALPDGTFRPDEPFQRVEMALALSDLLDVFKGGRAAPGFYGGGSPFPDMTSDSFGLHAAVVCVARGIMQAEKDGRFGPNDPVSGLDGVNDLNRLKAVVSPGGVAAGKSFEVVAPLDQEDQLKIFFKVVKSGLMFLI